MKLPSSSSLLFATLAISSSSTTLAAPAGDASSAEGGMSASHSARDIGALVGREATTESEYL